ncbi:MAG: membrane protein insertion efficiency factor YidD [Peptococcaceae bacterium]|nr:membrane protein insertion efficiency factor YidD [Peptococcaceae bacterium]
MRILKKLVKRFLIGIIVCYQKYISPLKPRTCRFYPTCSEYALQAIKKYGIIKGTGKALFRIIKCNPFHPGGYDPV